MARLALTRTRACDQARSLVSLRLDDELSELEGALLEAHLGACEGCREFADETAMATRELRAAPLERLAHPIWLPAPRRRAYLRGLQTAAAGAVAAAAVVAGVIGFTPMLTDDGGSTARAAGRLYEPVKPRVELQLYHRAQPSEGSAGPVIPI
jgi:predicted anti-sigma-YlaC factor YlaD